MLLTDPLGFLFLILLIPVTMEFSGQDRSYGRSVVVTDRGIVATSHYLASQAGAQILAKGGTAMDAAIAANAVLGVTEPMNNGIGGDLFLIYWDAKAGKLYGLNSSGWAPAGDSPWSFWRNRDHVDARRTGSTPSRFPAPSRMERCTIASGVCPGRSLSCPQSTTRNTVMPCPRSFTPIGPKENPSCKRPARHGGFFSRRQSPCNRRRVFQSRLGQSPALDCRAGPRRIL